MKHNKTKATVWHNHERKHHEAQGASVWQKNSSQVRAALGLPRYSTPWTGRRDVKLHGVMPNCSRQKDLIDVAWEARCKELRGQGSATLANNLLVDVSQTILRKPWSAKLRPFRVRGQLCSFQADRCLDGTDAMRLLGWPASRLDGIPSGDILHLAAVSGCLPLATIVMLGMTANPWGSWHSQKPNLP